MDHLPYHAFEHYKPLYKGGFKWLLDHGVSFDNFHLEHGYAATAPGHFVLGSGLHPGPAGLLGNHFYDKTKGRDVYCIEDHDANELGIPAYPNSYRNVPGTTFGDWLKTASPESRVIGVGCKDRAAILLSGRHADLAVWYNWRGAFTTNSYYTESIPGWLDDFNSKIDMPTYRDSLWTKSLADSVYDQYAHADFFPGETDRYKTEVYSPVFPIGFEEHNDDGEVVGKLGDYPWMDRMTLELASTTVQENDLGKDDIPDVLTVGLTVMDIVNHYYGPYSHESMDLLVKIDGYLQTFLNDLDEEVGLEHVLFTLTTDHGGLPLPEHWTQIMGKNGGRIDKSELGAARLRALNRIKDIYGTHDFILRKGTTYFYDRATMDSLGVNRTQIDSIMVTHLESVEGVGRVYTKTELLDPIHEDKNAIRLSRITHPELSPDLYSLVEEGWIYRGPHGTSHLAPYDYDSHIPLLISHLNYSPSSLRDSVQMADVAPTLGDLLGVEPAHPVDGKSLLPLLPH